MNDEFLKLFARASRSFMQANPKLFAAQLERSARAALVDPLPGKEKGAGRARVRITTRRVRRLDPDNNAGSVKTIIDLLCRVGLIHGDSPKEIELQVAQEKVAHRNQQETIIEIWPINE